MMTTDYAKFLQGEACISGLNCNILQIWKKGFDSSRKKTIKALILDGRCPLSEREIELPRSNLVTKAITFNP
jgi:hypothetical protein